MRISGKYIRAYPEDALENRDLSRQRKLRSTKEHFTIAWYDNTKLKGVVFKRTKYIYHVMNIDFQRGSWRTRREQSSRGDI